MINPSLKVLSLMEGRSLEEALSKGKPVKLKKSGDSWASIIQNYRATVASRTEGAVLFTWNLTDDYVTVLVESVDDDALVYRKSELICLFAKDGKLFVHDRSIQDQHWRDMHRPGDHIWENDRYSTPGIGQRSSSTGPKLTGQSGLTIFDTHPGTVYVLGAGSEFSTTSLKKNTSDILEYRSHVVLLFEFSKIKGQAKKKFKRIISDPRNACQWRSKNFVQMNREKFIPAIRGTIRRIESFLD
jgi:hypothetical protein